MSEPSAVPFRALVQQAQAAAQAHQWPQAASLLLQAAGQTSAREQDYVVALGELRKVLVQQRLGRAALTVDWYLGDAQRQSQLLAQVPLGDQARTLQAWGELEEDPARARQHFLKAAELYEQAGLVAQCAIARERAEDWASARALWSRLGQVLAGRPAEQYAEGLARFNLSRCCQKLGDASAAHAAVVASVHLLEQAADGYERSAQRERAFDCYQVLIAIGRHSQQFEHVLEGFVNVSRILREDHLRYYAIQSNEEAIDAAREAGELTAGATLAQELASYAETQGLVSVANYGARLRAQLWQDVARQAIERGAPAELAENALLAAIVTLARQGQFQTVGTLYASLATLDLEPARQQHYARASTRYRDVSDVRLDAAPLPAHLRQETPYPEVWHVDLVEWEQAGNAAAACGDVVLDRKGYSEITRRRALLARLAALDGDAAEGRIPPDATLSGLADLLGRVELYAILSPLESLFRSPSAPVRLAVMRAMERLMFKRSFVTVRQGLADPDRSVRAQACKAVEALRFPHAFDPLGRIYREAAAPEARAAALRAIARIDTAEAGELLLGVFQHEAELEREAALEALKKARGAAFLELARRSWSTLSPEVQTTIRQVFQARGEML